MLRLDCIDVANDTYMYASKRGRQDIGLREFLHWLRYGQQAFLSEQCGAIVFRQMCNHDLYILQKRFDGCQ